MILKTIAFLLLMYLLIKFISGLFLPSAKRKRSTARAFYQIFKNIQQQQKKQQQQQRPSQNSNKQTYFEEVEEADFEDITEDQSHSS